MPKQFRKRLHRCNPAHKARVINKSNSIIHSQCRPRRQQKTRASLWQMLQSNKQMKFIVMNIPRQMCFRKHAQARAGVCFWRYRSLVSEFRFFEQTRSRPELPRRASKCEQPFPRHPRSAYPSLVTDKSARSTKLIVLWWPPCDILRRNTIGMAYGKVSCFSVESADVWKTKLLPKWAPFRERFFGGNSHRIA